MRPEKQKSPICEFFKLSKSLQNKIIMKKMIKLGLLLVAFVAFNTTMEAQKFGYVNSQAILAEMAEVKQAQAKMEALGKQLEKKGQQMVADFETEYKSLSEKQQSGTLSPKQLQEESAKLEQKRGEIDKYRQSMQQQLLEKEQTELKPIIDKVNQAIQDYAKANGYQFIFDAGSQMNFILYADEGTDLTEKIKAKL